MGAASGPEVYGLKNQSVEIKRKSREGNVLALRARDTALRAREANKPLLLEQPYWRKDKTSTLALPEYQGC